MNRFWKWLEEFARSRRTPEAPPAAAPRTALPTQLPSKKRLTAMERFNWKSEED